MEEQVKTTKRKRKTKKDDGIDLANVCSDTLIICVVQYSLVYEGFSKRCCKKVIIFAWIFTDILSNVLCVCINFLYSSICDIELPFLFLEKKEEK